MARTILLSKDYFEGVLNDSDNNIIQDFFDFYHDVVKLTPMIISRSINLSEEEWDKLHRLDRSELSMGDFKKNISDMG